MKKSLNNLYSNLMDLCDASGSEFFFADQTTVMGTQVRIFNYHLASYSDWLKPAAIECRGIMFQMKDGKPVALLSRPMQKFFNYAELKAWEKLDRRPAQIGSEVVDVMIKEDGSLISTFSDNGYLGVKSKGSVKSDQAVQAQMYIQTQPKLATRLMELVTDGYTVNMEYVAPTNRIVMGYEEARVIILNVRRNDDGTYVPYADLFSDAVLRPYLVEREKIEVTDLDAFVAEVYQMEGFEGYVIATDAGFVKVKTNWYVALHQTKDSLNNNKALFLNIAGNTSDDLKQLFLDDVVALKKIDAFETLFLDSLNRLIALADKKIEDTKGKSRKDYAIALSSDLTPDGKLVFGPLMKYFEETDKQKLVDRIVEMMVKNYELFVPDTYK